MDVNRFVPGLENFIQKRQLKKEHNEIVVNDKSKVQTDFVHRFDISGWDEMDAEQKRYALIDMNEAMRKNYEDVDYKVPANLVGTDYEKALKQYTQVKFFDKMVKYLKYKNSSSDLLERAYMNLKLYAESAALFSSTLRSTGDVVLADRDFEALKKVLDEIDKLKV